MGYGWAKQGKINPRARVLAERAEALAGNRPQAPDQRAVTVADVAAQGTLKLLSAKASAAPTMEQHNALVEDVHALAAILTRMGAKITGF